MDLLKQSWEIMLGRRFAGQTLSEERLLWQAEDNEQMTTQSMSNLRVFAYGSNMCLPRMRARVPSAHPLTIGYVRQRQFVFHKRSDDGSAKADAMRALSEENRVWGVVYQLQEREKPLLDQCEFLGIGYDHEVVDVVHQGGTSRAWMYVARPDAIDASLLPYVWYHELILHGARQQGLPPGYVEYLTGFDAVADPDATRKTANRRHLIG